jgi:hypothetical protein
MMWMAILWLAVGFVVALAFGTVARQVHETTKTALNDVSAGAQKVRFSTHS